jgi:hypothetical protein
VPTVPAAAEPPPPSAVPAALEEHAGDAKTAARAQSTAFTLLILVDRAHVVGCIARSIFWRSAFP